MKKSLYLFIALVAAAANLFAQDCETVPSAFTGNASITLQRYKHTDLTGLFTVNASGKQVRFSQGNLQYRASSGKWRFAENQWDVLGNTSAGGNTTAAVNRPTQTKWIDLFAFGTSGWNSGANYYQPWAASSTNSDYRESETVAQTSDSIDWAFYNPIINGGIGGDAPAAGRGQWRVLTTAEWLYVFNSRKDAAEHLLYEYGVLMSVNGIFLLPDEWDWTTFLSGLSEGAVKTALTTLSTNWRYGTTKDYATSEVSDADVWAALEAAGVVFLPTTGNRSGTKVNNLTYGYYWSSTDLNAIGQARGILFFSGTLTPQRNLNREWGCAVRPVHDL